MPVQETCELCSLGGKDPTEQEAVIIASDSSQGLLALLTTTLPQGPPHSNSVPSKLRLW